MRSRLIALSAAALLTPLLTLTPLGAKDPPKRPQIFEDLVSCRAIADAAARLACYDNQVTKLDAAERGNEVVVVDKAEIKKARKGLFGLTLPDLGIFGSKKDGEPEEELTEIESTIKSASQNGAGKWVFVIEDGARWVQTDTINPRTPKPGMKIRIHKAAMGSFFANVAERPAIRVKREN